MAPVTEAPAPLDWAMLLPLDAKVVIRFDLARLRRTPYWDVLETFLTLALGELQDEALRPAFKALLDRTDVVLAALDTIGDDGDESFMLLARGAYRPDELERLWASAREAPHITEADDLRVWSAESGDLAGAMTLLRADTVLLTDTVPGIERVIARTRMASGGPRWPESVRGLIESLDIEGATLAVVMGERFPEEDGPPFALGGRADIDGPIDVDVRMSFQDEVAAAGMAAAAGVFLRALTQGADGAPSELAELANLADIDVRGSEVRVRVQADRETTERLVPALVGSVLHALGADDDEEDDPL